jgi:hypothetical protein
MDVNVLCDPLVGFDIKTACSFGGALGNPALNPNTSIASTLSIDSIIDPAVAGVDGDDVLYNMVAISCSNADMTIGLDWHYTNPGGEELSADQIPLKGITMAFAWIWAGLMGALALLMVLATGGGKWLQYRMRQHGVTGSAMHGVTGSGNDGSALDTSSLLQASAGGAADEASGGDGTAPPAPSASVSFREAMERVLALPSPLKPVRLLHWVLLMLPVAFILSAIVARSYWLDASATGSFSKSLAGAAAGVGAVAASALVAIILIVAKGWKITRVSLERPEVSHVVVLTALYLLAWVCWQVLGGGFLFLFGLVLTYCLVLRFVFVAVEVRLQLLQAFQMLLQRDGHADEDEEAAAAGYGRGYGTAGYGYDDSIYESMDEDADLQMAMAASRQAASASGRSGAAASGSGRPTASQYSEYPAASHYPSAFHSEATGGDGGSSTPDMVRGSQYQSMGVAQGPDADAVAMGPESMAPSVAAQEHSRPRAPWWRRAIQAVTGIRVGGGTAGAGRTRQGSYGLQRRHSRCFGLCPQSSESLTERQIRVLKTFRLAVLFFLVADVMVQMWSVMTFNDSGWIGYLISQILASSMVAFMFLVFRPRADVTAGPLYDPQGYYRTENAAIAYENILQATAAAAGTGSYGYTEESPPLILVQNPDTIDSTGKLVRSVAIAEPSGPTSTVTAPAAATSADPSDATPEQQRPEEVQPATGEPQWPEYKPEDYEK